MGNLLTTVLSLSRSWTSHMETREKLDTMLVSLSQYSLRRKLSLSCFGAGFQTGMHPRAVCCLPYDLLLPRVGRKPVMLIGLSGVAGSLILFGLSRTFWTLVASRCLSGLLNGNVGVIKVCYFVSSVLCPLTDLMVEHGRRTGRFFEHGASLWAHACRLGDRWYNCVSLSIYL
jgi:MFS family permease